MFKKLLLRISMKEAVTATCAIASTITSTIGSTRAGASASTSSRARRCRGGGIGW